MKLDEYQIQKHKRISDNLFIYSDRMVRLQKNAEFIDEIHYASAVSDLLEHIYGVTKDMKDLEKYSWEKETRDHYESN